VLANWLLSRQITPQNQSLLIFCGVTFNLLLIGIFKYLDFFAGTAYFLAAVPYQPFELILPLGISFFTFQQISYLVDRSRGQAPPYPLLDYALYVTFFPQLIAGPIVRHNEIIPQFKKSPRRPDIFHHCAAGLLLFTIGLAKKTLLADQMAEIATPLFDTAATGDLLNFGQSWLASVSYALQLYFDFSGYSDMAIGLALMLGLRLPVNFDAPYRAGDIQEFWNRWHMTLSRFLRDYLYIPLGSSRHGPFRLAAALLFTMLLGGLWHGAGWTFVIWGLMHGLALVCHRIWLSSGYRLPLVPAWIVTAVFLLFGWVMFRADTASTAWTIWVSMTGGNGLSTELQSEVNALLIVGAALLAIVGPTSQVVIEKLLTPRIPYAVLTGLTLFYLTLRVASDGYTEFLYFQF
jgi:alginate O-acetyltransferase complex protein AlgI